MPHIIANAVKFQAGWVLVVLYGNTVAVACAIVALIIYGKWFYTGIQDVFLIAVTVALGFVGDTLLGFFGLLAYPSGLAVPPFWMITLWLLFSMTLPWSVRPLIRKRLVFVVFCIIGGPLSYVAGVRLTDVEFGLEPMQAIPVLVAVWIVYGLILSNLVRRWEAATDRVKPGYQEP
ncbi:MAG: DUF2878 domain-containing protein [Gammaproteobacteria bacterium]|nr:DUF2878 domain-containing protein [Gammaproteobacteria bacterium]